MSSNYQQKKMMNALGAIDTKGNIVLEQFQDGTALLFQPGNAQPFCVATDYDRATASWSYGKYFSDLGCAYEAATLRLSRTPASDGSMIGKINQSTVDELKTVTIADSCKESFGAVIGIWVQSMIFDLITIIIKGSVSVMCYMRAMQLYVMAAFSPLPFALLGFDETKNYGVSFCKNFLATCLAGVIILFAMGLFPNLLSGFSGGEISGFKGDMWSSVCASVALMLIVIKSGTIARDVFGG